MTYSALFCSVVNKFYVLLHFIKYEVVQSHDAHSARDDLRQRTRAAHHRAAFSGTIYRWSRWRPAFLIYTHLRLQHWDIFSWSIRILRCPWCFVYRLWFWYIFDTQDFLGAFLALPQQLVVDRCWCLLSKGYFITSSVFLAIKKETHFWPESFFLTRWDSLRERFIPRLPSSPPWCSWGVRRRSCRRRSWTRGRRRRSRSTRTSHPRSSVSAWTCNQNFSIKMFNNSYWLLFHRKIFGFLKLFL